MYVLRLFLRREPGQLERELELVRLAGVVDPLLQEAELVQQLHRRLPAQGLGPKEGDLEKYVLKIGKCGKVVCVLWPPAT